MPKKTRKDIVTLTEEIVISIDPGEKAGVAVFINNELNQVFMVNGAKPEEIHKVMVKLNRSLKEKHSFVPIIAVIEDGFVGINPKASSTLSMRRGFFYFVCSMFGYQIELRMPTFWQSRTFPEVRDEIIKLERLVKKVTTKDKSLLFVKKFFSKENISHDVADAVCLGHAYINEGKEINDDR